MNLITFRPTLLSLDTNFFRFASPILRTTSVLGKHDNLGISLLSSAFIAVARECILNPSQEKCNNLRYHKQNPRDCF